MLVVMTCTFAIAAPITIVVGIVFALREHVGLSVILAVAIPAAAIVLGIIVAEMVPAFQLMQERIDQINRVLRGQITGIRVVRAFVREPQETRRFERTNDDLTEVSLRAGRLMSSMFPIVNLLINLSSAAVIWLGVDRIASGDINVGAMIAYLTYIVQILWSVVMATFMVSMMPRASVSSERIMEVLDTDPSVEPPANLSGGHERRPRPARCRLPLSGCRARGAERRELHRPGTTTAIVGSTGAARRRS